MALFFRDAGLRIYALRKAEETIEERRVKVSEDSAGLLNTPLSQMENILFWISIAE